MINPLGKSLVAGSRKSLFRWRQRGPDIDSGSAVVTRFGERSAMSNDGDIIAISGIENTIGFVQVYKWDGIKYEPLGSKLSYGQANDEFGFWVDLNSSGTRLLVCAAEATNRAFIYHFNGTDWVLNRTFQKVGTQSTGIACISISGSGNRLVLGEGYFGSAYLWEWDGTQWNSLGRVTDGQSGLKGLGVTISGDGFTLGSSINGFSIFRVESSGSTQRLSWDGSGAGTPTSPLKRNWLNEDGSIFIDEEGQSLVNTSELARYREPAPSTAYLNILDTRVPAMNLPNTMMSKTARMISNQIISGTYFTRVYDITPSYENGYTKVGQDIPHTGDSLGYGPTSPWTIDRAYPAISGDGNTIGRGQSSRPNSLPYQTGSQSYTVHRLTIE